MIGITWHPLAKRELFEASAYYEGESKGLGDVFLDAIHHGIERLKLHPRTGREILGEIRWFLVGRFPYSLVYRIDADGRQERLFILAVAHQKRRPRYWAGRP